MNPMIRIAAVAAALAGAVLIARMTWRAVAANLTVMRSWTRTEGEVRAMNGAVEFELGREPDEYRALAAVDHTWGLSLFKRAPLFVDPNDPKRIKTAGFLQMWLTPAGMSGFVLLLLSIAFIAARAGTGNPARVAEQQAHGQWMFTESPGPLSGGVSLRSPDKRWKAALFWSILGIAMASVGLFVKGGNPLSRIGYTTLGTAFTLALWGLAWHTKSMEISANHQGIRMTSVLGWRDVPWSMIRSVEDQHIFTTYYNGTMHMWEMPFPGSTVRVFAFNDANGHTLMSFSPELEPHDALKRVFELCTEQTGSKLRDRTIAIRY
jgi:hypothetical protein